MMDYSLTTAYDKKYNRQTLGYGTTAGTAANPYNDFLARRGKLSTLSSENAKNQINSPTQVNKFSTNVIKSKTKIIKGSLFSTPTYMPTMKTIKDFGKALKGEGTDHSLGAINDPAIALGSLAIAGTLATLAKSPHSKLMEFVGAGTWLGSMVLWPKLILAAPIKAKTGVDMNMEYINDQGEQKPFHRDAQYKPWDAVPEEMYDEMGRKLKVPENHPNRKAEIQRKADKVATGVNTWWMLSAGFSTPLMASVIANRIEKPLQKAIDKTRVFSADVHLQAAGYETGNKGFLHRMGKAILKPFYDRKINKEQQEIEQLHKLVDEKEYDKVAKFYKKNLHTGKNEIASAVLVNIDESIKTLRNNPADKEATAFLKGAFGEAKGFERDHKLLSNYSNATLSHKWGSDRKFTLRKLNKALGIKGKTYKELMKLSKDDVNSASEILAPIIKAASENQNVKDKIDKITTPAVDNARKYGGVINKISQTMGEKYANSVIDNAHPEYKLIKSRIAGVYTVIKDNKQEERVGAIAKKASEKVIGIDNTLNFKPIFKQADKNNSHVFIAGIGNNETWNTIRNRVPDPDNKRKILEKFYDDSEAGKKTVDTFMDFYNQTSGLERDARRVTIENVRGESKAGMLLGTVKEQGKWFKRVGIIGLGSLLAATGAALWLIARNGKKDAERGGA